MPKWRYFSGQFEATAALETLRRDGEIKDLRAKIGQLVVENGTGLKSGCFAQANSPVRA